MKHKKSTLKGRNRNVRKTRTNTVDLHGIPVSVTRKQMKHLRLRVLSADRSVHLSVPFGVSEEQAMLFLSSKEDWIRKTIDSLKSLPSEGADTYRDGDTFFLWGTRYTLSLSEGGSRYSLSLSDSDQTAYLCVPLGSTPEKRARYFREFYKKGLSAYLNTAFPRWESATGLTSSSRDIRYMKSRWGSCNTKTRHIRMNLRLAEYPKICTDYVVLHELCHLKIPNHGKDFKALLDTYMPNWKDVRALLNGK